MHVNPFIPFPYTITLQCTNFISHVITQLLSLIYRWPISQHSHTIAWLYNPIFGWFTTCRTKLYSHFTSQLNLLSHGKLLIPHSLCFNPCSHTATCLINHIDYYQILHASNILPDISTLHSHQIFNLTTSLPDLIIQQLPT